MLRPWTPRLVLRRGGPAPIYLQIVRALIDDIRAGRLSPGTALPGSRELASSLGVSRKTVVQAYEELVGQGWLSSEGTRGTFVLPHLPPGAPAPQQDGLTVAPGLEIRRDAPDLAAFATASAWRGFDDGLPDVRLLPAEALARAHRRALLAAARGNRPGYGDPRGSEALRQAIATMLSVERGTACTARNVCLVRGTQMGIFIAARLLARAGDTVAVEALSYPPAREAFRAAGAEVATVGIDEQGLRVDDLERLCRRRRVRAIYLTPHHQYPTTVVLRPQRRLQVMALAGQFGFAVVEDDYDHEFHFAHRPMLPLVSADHDGRVIYVGSMSKLLSPSLRLGWLAAPAAFIDRAAAELMVVDRQGDVATEAAVAELIGAGVVRAHARRALRVYAERQQAFAAALREVLGDDVAFAVPEGGLALWVRFAASIDMAALEREAVLQRVGLLAGRLFAVDRREVAAARLGFASLDAADMRAAVLRLGRAVARARR